MNATTTTTVNVMDYKTGEKLGEIAFPADGRAEYQAGNHEGFQWPEGIAAAKDVLKQADIDHMDIRPDTTIFLD